MIVYLDTSALVKRYMEEAYSEEILYLWKQSSWIVTSTVAYAETLAAFSRKRQELRSGSHSSIEAVQQTFAEDWNALIRVDVTDELKEYVDHVFDHHFLRGFDAIHLASAIMVREKVEETFLFACFDYKLLSAAGGVGLETFSGLVKK